jgi:hypothetical protein
MNNDGSKTSPITGDRRYLRVLVSNETAHLLGPFVGLEPHLRCGVGTVHIPLVHVQSMDRTE